MEHTALFRVRTCKEINQTKQLTLQEEAGIKVSKLKVNNKAY